ncbi:MAG: hypothetical protein AABW88_02820, partial [Nanoarchaeota archaeon]
TIIAMITPAKKAQAPNKLLFAFGIIITSFYYNIDANCFFKPFYYYSRLYILENRNVYKPL